MPEMPNVFTSEMAAAYLHTTRATINNWKKGSGGQLAPPDYQFGVEGRTDVWLVTTLDDFAVRNGIKPSLPAVKRQLVAQRQAHQRRKSEGAELKRELEEQRVAEAKRRSRR